MALLNPDASDGRPDAIGVLDLEEGSSTLRRARRASSTCRTPATSCTTSAGTPAAPPCAPGRRTRTWSGATSWCRACAPRASTSSTWATTRAQPTIAKVIEPEELIAQDRLLAAAHLALRARGDLHERPRRRRERRRPGRDLPARLRELRPARAVGGRPRAPALRLRLLVAPRLRHAHLERVGHAGHVRERRGAGEAARPASTATSCTSGTCASAGHRQAHRPGRRAPDGARAAAGPRPAQDVRLRGRRGVRGGPERLGLALVRAATTARSRPSKVITIPAVPDRPGRAAARAEGLRRRAAARDRHQPVARRPLALRLLLGHGRAPPVRRVRPVRRRSTPARSRWAASRRARPIPRRGR